jgi:hypothetical protein
MARTCVSFASFITNSGQVNFRVKDEQGPMIVIHSTCGGNQRYKQEFYVKKEFLSELAKCFEEAAKHEYTSHPHHNQGESPTCYWQGDIDEYGDGTPQSCFGYGDCEVTDWRTLSDRGYHLTATLMLDDNTTRYSKMQIVPGTAWGKVWRMGKEVQQFGVDKDGKMMFVKTGDPTIFITEGVVDHKMCTAQVTWNDLPGNNYLTLSFSGTSGVVI